MKYFLLSIIAVLAFSISIQAGQESDFDKDLSILFEEYLRSKGPGRFNPLIQKPQPSDYFIPSGPVKPLETTTEREKYSIACTDASGKYIGDLFCVRDKYGQSSCFLKRRIEDPLGRINVVTEARKPVTAEWQRYIQQLQEKNKR